MPQGIANSKRTHCRSCESKLRQGNKTGICSLCRWREGPIGSTGDNLSDARELRRQRLLRATASG